VYGTNTSGTNVTYGLASIVRNDTIPLRTSYGSLRIADPTDNTDATTKKYVDDLAATKLDKTNLPLRLYNTNNNG
jgi:hypothetical protein